MQPGNFVIFFFTRQLNTEYEPRGKRTSRVKNPESGGLTFDEFQELYIGEFGDRYNCKVCDFKLTKFNIKKHVKRCHCTCKPYFCELCPEGFKKIDDRTKHMAEKHPSDFKCGDCDIQFYTSTNYVEHVSMFHQKIVQLKPLKPKAEIDVPIERLRFVAEIFDREVSQAN